MFSWRLFHTFDHKHDRCDRGSQHQEQHTQNDGNDSTCLFLEVTRYVDIGGFERAEEMLGTTLECRAGLDAADGNYIKVALDEDQETLNIYRPAEMSEGSQTWECPIRAILTGD